MNIIIDILVVIAAGIFFSGIYFRLRKGIAGVKDATEERPERPVELDHLLIAYVRRNGVDV